MRRGYSYGESNSKTEKKGARKMWRSDDKPGEEAGISGVWGKRRNSIRPRVGAPDRQRDWTRTTRRNGLRGQTPFKWGAKSNHKIPIKNQGGGFFPSSLEDAELFPLLFYSSPGGSLVGCSLFQTERRSAGK